MSNDFLAKKEHEAVRLVSKILSDHDPRYVLLVGSVARGYAQPHSDIDLLVIDSSAKNMHSARVDTVLQADESIKLEYYSSKDLAEMLRGVGPNIVRQLNRLREAKVLYQNLGANYEEIRPRSDDVRKAFGRPDLFVKSVEENLAAAFSAHDDGVPEEVLLRSYMAGEALVFLLLSIGAVPVAYTKSKWVLLGLKRLGNSECLEAYLTCTASQQWSERTGRDPAVLAKFLAIVHSHCPQRLLSESRPLRRILWITEKNHRDAASLISTGDSVGSRSAVIGCASFGLQAIALSQSWPYEGLVDAPSILRRIPTKSRDVIRTLLFPNGPPSSEMAARSYNAAVRLHSEVLKLLDIPQPD